MWELMKSAIAKKALQMSKDSGTTPIKSNVTSSSSKSSSSSKTNSSTSSNSTSSKSYAYDPSGNKVDVIIKNGQSYLSDGSRIGTGYTVQTGGGIYKMTDSGGIKVDSHNTSNLVSGGKAMNQPTGGKTIENDRSNISSSRTWTDSNGKTTYADTISSIAPKDSYSGLNYDFESKYNSIIKKLAEYGTDGKPVTMDVAKNMLVSNIEQSMKGEAPMYDGGGVINTGDWNQIVNDYKLLKEAATSSAMNTKTTDAYGRELTGEQILSDLRSGNVSPDYTLGQNLSGYSQDELAYGYDQIYGSGAGGTGGGAIYSDVPMAGYAPQSGGIINYNITNGIDPNMWADAIKAIGSGQPSPIEIDLHIPLGNGADPMSGLYKSGNNYAINEGGKIVQISEDDYVAYLSRLVNF